MHTLIKAAARCGKLCLHDAKCKTQACHLYILVLIYCIQQTSQTFHQKPTQTNLFDDLDLVVQRVFTDGVWYIKICKSYYFFKRIRLRLYVFIEFNFE